MLICFTVYPNRANEIYNVLTSISEGRFQVDVSAGTEEFSTVDVNFEEFRDVSVAESVAAVLAFYSEVEGAI